VLLVELIAAGLIVFAARPRAVVWIAGAGVLVNQGSWPVVTSAGGFVLYAGDVFALVAALAALAHPKQRTLWRTPVALLVLLATWTVLRSDQMGQIAFGRCLFPLAVMLLVSWIIADNSYDLRRDLRWFPISALASVFLIAGGHAGRWTSIAGGPNQTGLIGAVAIVLGFTYRGRWRLAMWAVGTLLLVGTASITATLAAVLGSLYYATAWRATSRHRLGTGSPLLAVTLVVVAVIAIPLLRLDLVSTTDAHLFQVSKFGRVLRDGDPLLGSGWGNVDLSAFVNTEVLGLHNVYLDVFAYLGAVGFVLFLGVLFIIWRRADVVARSLLVAWAVWVNTSGAFPGTAWGVLGCLLAFAAFQEPLRDVEAPAERRPSATRNEKAPATRRAV
jgi:hypothetical protein